MIKNTIYLLSLIFLLITAIGCGGNQKMMMPASMSPQMATDQANIIDYLKTNALKTEQTASGIHYIIEREGDGEKPSPFAVATVNYHGFLLDGSQFWSSYDNGKAEQFQLNQVIDGWMEGIPLIKKGGKVKLIIPSELAYKEVGWGKVIPPNSVLIFEVELIDFYETQMNTDQELIQQHIKEKGISTTRTKSGLHYIIQEEGSAEKPTANSKVTVNYAGSLLNGQEFWSTYTNGKTEQHQLNRVIAGWTEGMPLVGKGGKVKLIIPSPLGYQAKGWGEVIPPNAVLIFDVEVIDF